MREFNIYIDESGDEGINRGSKYFILTAIIVEKEKDLSISKMVDKIKGNLELDIKNQLHWNKVKGFPNKKMIMEHISNSDLIIINIVIDTTEIKFIHSNNIYNYFSGYLFERICWYVSSKNGMANINISSRGNLRKEELINFLNDKNNKKFKIDSSKISGIKIYPNSKKKLLQLADCCCSSLGQALKYNDKIHFQYIKYLKPKFYTHKSKYIGYGLKYVPSTQQPSKEFQELVIYLEKIV